jgi:ABC-2 type transport system ATP-binding protein
VTTDLPAVETAGLAKRYGSVVALQDCTVTVPRGRISALVGPNGAGKTTLLHLLAGLRTPSAGWARVFGRTPGQDPAFLADVGFLAQEMPLWRRFSAADHVEIGAHLNPRWDAERALERLRTLAIPLDRSTRPGCAGARPCQAAPASPPRRAARRPRPARPTPLRGVAGRGRHGRGSHCHPLLAPRRRPRAGL